MDLNLKLDFPPAEKLLELLGRFVSAAFEPEQIRRVALARADEAKIAAQGNREAQAIAAGDLSLPGAGIMIPFASSATKSGAARPAPSFKSVEERAQARVIQQEVKRQENLERVAAHAIRELSNKVSDKPVDADWAARFFTAAQDVSLESMQQLWSRMLVGELAAPGSFSTRTVETLKTMSVEEAQQFDKIARYEMFQVVPSFPERENFWVSRGITYNNILELGAIGLLEPDATLWSEVTSAEGAGRFERWMDHADQRLIFWHPLPHRMLKVPGYPLTRSGRELARLIKTDRDEEFYSAVSQFGRVRGYGIKRGTIITDPATGNCSITDVVDLNQPT